MAEVRQKMRGTTLQLDGYSGPEGQFAYDMERKEGRFYDGILLGGYRIPNKTTNDAAYAPDRLKADAGVDTADLNTALSAGFYRHTAAAANIPLAVAGAVIVAPSTNTATGDVTQFWMHNSLNIAYMRVRKTAVWTAWVRLVDKTLADATYLGIAAQAVDSALLGGNNAAFYTNIVARLGYTPLNKGGDTFAGNMAGGNFNLTGVNLVFTTSTSAITLAGAVHALQAGPSTGQNIALGVDTIQARNNGVAASLKLNRLGGSIDMSAAAGLVLPQTANPLPTAEGETWWKPSEDSLYIGDGAAPRIFRPNAWEFITLIASGMVAQVDVANLANYRELRISYECTVSADGTSLFLRVSTDNGSTFLAGAAEYNNFYTINTGAAVTGSNAAATGFSLDAAIGIDNGANLAIRGVAHLQGFNTVNPVQIINQAFMRNSAAAGRLIQTGGDGTSAVAKNAIRFIPGTGNISILALIEGLRG